MRIFTILSVCLSFGLAACGGDDGPNVRHGSKNVSDLSTQERADICEDSEALLDDIDEDAFIRFYCLAFVGAFGECTEAAVDDCVTEAKANPSETTTSECDWDDAGFDVAACDVTVDQLFDCVGAQLDQIEELGTNGTCADVTTGSSAPMTLEECAVVEEKCPQALVSGDEA